MRNRSKRPTILVVNEDEDTLELLGEYLGARGMEVLTAYAADEAVALVRSITVEALFVEVGDGGSELALIRESRLRASPAGVVVTLMRESVSLAVAAMKAGASDVLRKPYRLVDVHEALQKALADRGEILARQAASERLLFFEAASILSDPEEVSRLLGLFAQVARRSCAAEEVAVWRASPTGWNAVARGGQVQALDSVKPSDVLRDGPTWGADMAAHPLRNQHGEGLGVVAVAGGAPRVAGDIDELGRLSRVVVDAMERVSRGALTKS